MNQRKWQPQIFFGIAILSAAHAIQLALPLKGGIAQTVLLTYGHTASQPPKCHSFSKKDLAALLAYGDMVLIDVSYIINFKSSIFLKHRELIDNQDYKYDGALGKRKWHELQAFWLRH